MQALLDTIDALMALTPPLLAIDGPCGAGKSTLARRLKERYPDAEIIRMDDFFLQPAMRTEERLSEPGGNVDRERFLKQVLLPFSEGREVVYDVYSCRDQSLAPRRLARAPLYIVEGSYSLHPALRGYYDLKLFLDVDADTQAERIVKREGDRAPLFFSRWIPLENRYFEACGVRECSDFLLSKND